MDILALILAILAALLFLDGSRDRVFVRWSHLPLGLALLTIALICQFTSVTDHAINW